MLPICLVGTRVSQQDERKKPPQASAGKSQAPIAQLAEQLTLKKSTGKKIRLFCRVKFFFINQKLAKTFNFGYGFFGYREKMRLFVF